MSVEIVGSILSLIALLVTSAFVVLYAARSPWREGLLSRALMYVFAALAMILIYVFIRRWLPIPEWIQQWIGTGIYAVLVGVLVWLLIALLYAQAGHITEENPNYTPIRDWLDRQRLRRSARSEK